MNDKIERLDIEPRKFKLSSYDVIRMTVELPSGKVLNFYQGYTYETTDKEEIEFLSKLSHLVCHYMNDKDFRMWAIPKLKDLPSVYNTAYSSEMNVHHTSRNAVIAEKVADLVDNGYIEPVVKTKVEPEAPKKKSNTANKSTTKTGGRSVSKRTGK